MAIILEATYGKKLGLPAYSSHQYALTLQVELTDPTQIGAQSRRLYQLLQSCVDREIQKTGYLPERGIANWRSSGTGNAQTRPAGGNGRLNSWACSPKQKALVLKIVSSHHLDKTIVEALARDRFGKSVKALNRPEASALIDALLARTSGGNGTSLGP